MMSGLSIFPIVRCLMKKNARNPCRGNADGKRMRIMKSILHGNALIKYSKCLL